MRRNKENQDLVVRDRTSDTIEKSIGMLTIISMLVTIVGGIVDIVDGRKE